MILFHLFDNSRFSRINPSILCTDPDSLGVGGGSNFDFSFKLTRVETREDPNTTKSGHHRPASDPPYIWRFAGVPMMTQH